jgi:hypothetical protein
MKTKYRVLLCKRLSGIPAVKTSPIVSGDIKTVIVIDEFGVG